MSHPDLLRQQCYIGGEWCDADSGATFAIHNPASGECIGAVPLMGAAETRRAIAAANNAWQGWKNTSANERAAILRRWHDLMLDNAAELARILTTEQGKPLAEALGEIQYAASYLEWFAEEAKRVYGDTIPGPAADRRIVVTREPVGVCAAITPWNFPAAMITRKAGAALAAGCVMIVKPAEQTPFSALAMMALAEQAGVPKGVFSVLTGDAPAIGGELTASPLVRKLSFTGSTEIGRLLMQQSAATVKKLSLELGGNAPFIVFDDADLDAAVEGAMLSKFRNAGQTCVCANRIYVQENVYDAFAAKLVQALDRLKVGNGLEPGVTQGPLIDAAAVRKVEEHIADALEKGGRLLAGGKPHRLGGHFYEPTVIAGATQAMKVAKEETFGPLAPLFRFHTEEEVVAMANDTEFGLACYFYTRDLGRSWRVGDALEYGMVGINTGAISNAAAPFGGVKQSGIGREGSKYGLDDYLVTKYRCIGL
ncbi:NAD-dependent succinate-semialdehyde dehydrogenase [Pseudoduganella sp. OTU4001]|uniref:NAD-dependent succinate-semialdehyde dehydrogenase n=1 Tax=Pseudoduganella sp. OTU4001 TaxID=3043854 RepID=UPI00313CED7D